MQKIPDDPFQPTFQGQVSVLSPIGLYVGYTDVIARELSGETVKTLKTRYGWVEIDHVRYDHDVIIHRDRSVTKRSKKKSKKLKNRFGHTPLADHELIFLEEEKPDIVFIGTGQYGDLPITIEAHHMLIPYDAVIRPTPEILDLFSEETRPSVAILHVSC